MMLTAGSLALYAATGVEEAKLSDEEVTNLAKATANVARHYPPQFSAKQQDLMALIYCIGQIAMVHYFQYQTRMTEERAAKARDVTNGQA